MTDLHEGMYLNSYAHGRIIVRKLYIHSDTKEMCLDCKSERGETLHISLAYGRRLLGQ